MSYLVNFLKMLKMANLSVEHRFVLHRGCDFYAWLETLLTTVVSGSTHAFFFSCWYVASSSGSHLSELSTMTHPSWVALPSMTHSFIELCKLLHHYKAVIWEGDNGLLLSCKKNEILSLAATWMDLENIMCACSVAQL